MNSSQILETTLKKVEKDPDLANDLVTYLKTLAVKYCPEDNFRDLQLLFENGNLSTFYDFLDQFVPDLSKTVINYVRAY